MIAALLLGVSYGFAAGISPGPMLGLVITQTLQRGWRAGNLVALAPLFSDLPIILLVVLLVGRLPPEAFGWLGIAGGAFVIYMGGETLWAARAAADGDSSASYAAQGPGGAAVAAADHPGVVLRRAVMTNLLNPHPYLFWSTVGAQLLVRSFRDSGLAAASLFLLGFYVLLVGAKLLIALLVHRSRDWLRGPAYQAVLAASGALLIGLGLLLAVEGLGSLL